MNANVKHVGFVADHIRASYPCSLSGVVQWCINQGLEESFGRAIASMILSREIELELDDGVVIINPL